MAGTARAALRDFRSIAQLDFLEPSFLDLLERARQLEARCASLENASAASDAIASASRVVRATLASGRPLSSLPVRDLKWAAFALFYPPASPAEWLARNPHVVQEYLEWLADSGSKRALTLLLRAFVLSYDPHLPTFELLRSGILHLLSAVDSPRVSERRAWATEHHVLELDGPAAFARGWHSEPTKFIERLSRLGKDGELALSEFVRRIEAVVCDEILAFGASLTETQLLAAINGLSIRDESGRARFRRPETGTRFADSVLLAHASRRPSERVRSIIRQALVDRLGDPRLPSSFAAWSSVSDRAQQVFRRWLVNDTLRVFFEVISEALQNSPEKKAQWEARRKFWSAYLDDISDAWVALSPSAIQVTGNDPAFRDIPHGRMEGNPNSVLIMTIDDLTLVEFSNVGGVRYWSRTESAENGPELFKESYRIADFQVNARSNIPHHDGWQGRVRTVIRRETGIRGNH